MIERYTEWLSKATEDPNNFVTLSQLEMEWMNVMQAVRAKHAEQLAETKSILGHKEEQTPAHDTDSAQKEDHNN